MKNMKKIFVDIDETICFNETKLHYEESTPIVENIMRVNAMYDDGHHITYYTARGSVTGKDHKDLTAKQLKEWGAKHHVLMMGKPPYDIMICDKCHNTRHWEQNKLKIGDKEY